MPDVHHIREPLGDDDGRVRRTCRRIAPRDMICHFRARCVWRATRNQPRGPPSNATDRTCPRCGDSSRGASRGIPRQHVVRRLRIRRAITAGGAWCRRSRSPSPSSCPRPGCFASIRAPAPWWCSTGRSGFPISFWWPACGSCWRAPWSCSTPSPARSFAAGCARRTSCRNGRNFMTRKFLGRRAKVAMDGSAPIVATTKDKALNWILLGLSLLARLAASSRWCRCFISMRPAPYGRS